MVPKVLPEIETLKAKLERGALQKVTPMQRSAETYFPGVSNLPLPPYHLIIQ